MQSTNLVTGHGLFIIKVKDYFMVAQRFQPGKSLEHEKWSYLVLVFFQFSDFISNSKTMCVGLMRPWISTSCNVCPVKNQWPVYGCMWRTSSNCAGGLLTSWVETECWMYSAVRACWTWLLYKHKLPQTWQKLSISSFYWPIPSNHSSQLNLFKG